MPAFVSRAKASYPKASILKAGRVVFNIKGNDYRLLAAVQYRAGLRDIARLDAVR
jgi:mRNA interferase HigB